jgi:hypothetical protein
MPLPGPPDDAAIRAPTALDFAMEAASVEVRPFAACRTPGVAEKSVVFSLQTDDDASVR